MCMNILFCRLDNREYKDQIYKSRIDTSQILANAIIESSHPPDVYVTMSGVGMFIIIHTYDAKPGDD
mgnify:FL=1